jgi:Concanavalin A-like lectin/glucanases superfamily
LLDSDDGGGIFLLKAKTEVEGAMRHGIAVGFLGVMLFGTAISQEPTKQFTWRFDDTASLGGHATKVLGHPKVIATPMGKAIAFNGVDDGLFADVHPLAGAETWTWEMVFKPDADGGAEQRIFHLQSIDPATGKDVAQERMLFEIRIRDGQWCLDSFATSGGQSKALLNCEKKYPFGKWYRVTTVYDGKSLKNYVGDELQGEGEVKLVPQRPGHFSVGVRMNLVDWYKGAIYSTRFTRSALGVGEFLKMPN